MKPFNTISFIVALFLILPNISLAAVQTFTSNGTFVVPAGITAVSVNLSGGGGGGVGAFGEASWIGSPTPGGATSFGSFISAAGGGVGWLATGGAAGGTGGTPGGSGTPGGNGGNGGSSLFGTGGAGVYNSYYTAYTAGIPGSGYGAGGGGSWSYYGGGGGAEAYQDKIFSVMPGQNISVTVGTGGIGFAVVYPPGGNGSGGFVQVTYPVFLPNTAPIASITIPTGDISVPQGQTVSFSGTGSDSDVGDTITTYEWREGNCNTGTLLSSSSSFNKSDFTVGSHTVYLRVQDSQNAWSTNCPSRAITVFVPPTETFKLCLNSCDSGSTNFNGGNITLNPSEIRNIRACYNVSSACDTNGGDVTGDVTTTFSATTNVPADAVSLTATKGQVQANATASGVSEIVNVSYGAIPASVTFSVPSAACVPDCSNAANTCQGQLFNAANGCGTNNCTGTRYCDFNWREVAP